MSTKPTERPPSTVVERVVNLPYVATVRETERDDSTHIVDLQQSSIGFDTHYREISQQGVVINTISSWGDYGLRLFVSID